jgi:hypothetical protein
MKLLRSIGAFWSWLVAEIKTARRGKVRPKDAIVIVHPASDPVVITPHSAYALPLSRVPARSTKRDAIRIAHQFAEEHSGRTMSWGQARKYIAKLEAAEPNLLVPVKGQERLSKLIPTFTRLELPKQGPA